MTYRAVVLPFEDLRALPKKRLPAYATWFLTAIPERLAELTMAVTTTPGYEGWLPDFTRHSLMVLGRWLATRVEFEDEDEMVKWHPLAPPVRNRHLTGLCLSLVFDLGMYFGEAFRRNHQHVEWKQDLSRRDYMGYGQMHLTGFDVPPNPTHLMHVVAHGLARNSHTTDRIAELYDIWLQRLSV